MTDNKRIEMNLKLHINKYILKTVVALLLFSFNLYVDSDAIHLSSGSATLQDTDPLKVLMITGGGPWHDYEVQKRDIERGLLERLSNFELTIDHEGGEERNFTFSRHANTDWAREFDLVIYNQCNFYDGEDALADAAHVEQIIAAHVEYQVPAVMLHCPMHVYQHATEKWFDFTGAVSYYHEDRRPFTVEVLEPTHPIMVNFPATWRTPHGELYMIVELKDGAKPLAHAYGVETEKYHEIAWTYEYEGVKVFSSTLGHHDETMGSDVNLNLIASGLLWAAGKLEDDGTPAPGYEGERGLGWISLWDGKSINGWRANEQTNWHDADRDDWNNLVKLSDSFTIEDGKLVAYGRGSHLFYDGPINGGDFKNFEFKTDVYTYPESMSGIFFHTRYQDYGRPFYGYEAQINSIPAETETHTPEFTRRKTGSLIPVRDISTVIHEDNTWFDYSITVNGSDKKVKLNGDLISQYNEPDHYEGTLGRGTIALQSNYPNSKVYFRNLMIRLWPD